MKSEAVMKLAYEVVFHPTTEKYQTRAEALRRAAAVSKFYDGVVRVFDPQGQFVKSFDGRKR
jgi:hypothetical protein